MEIKKTIPKPTDQKVKKIPISSRTSKIQGSLAREGEKEKTAITQMIKTAKALLRKLMLKNVKLTSRKNQEAAIEVGRLKEKTSLASSFQSRSSRLP